MAPGNLTISDSSSRQGLSCYLDVGRHDTRIDNITSISDVEGSEPRCCTRVIRTKRIFFRLEKDSYRKDFSATHLTIASLHSRYIYDSAAEDVDFLPGKSSCTNRSICTFVVRNVFFHSIVIFNYLLSRAYDRVF